MDGIRPEEYHYKPEGYYNKPEGYYNKPEGYYYKEELALAQDSHGAPPTALQTPLLLAAPQNLVGCATCQLLLTATELQPPQLPPPAAGGGRSSPVGSWGSTTCSLTPHGLFITRTLHFRDEQKWALQQRHFTDHLCSAPAYVLHAHGSFVLRTAAFSNLKTLIEGLALGNKKDLPSKTMQKNPGGRKEFLKKSPKKYLFVSSEHLKVKQEKNILNADNISESEDNGTGNTISGDKVLLLFMVVQNLSLTPLTQPVVAQLNHPRGGCGGGWVLGVTKDMTDTKGCKSLGITLPLVMKYPLKFGRDSGSGLENLYIGEPSPGFVEYPSNMSLVYPHQQQWIKDPDDHEFTVEYPAWGWGAPLQECDDGGPRTRTGAGGNAPQERRGVRFHGVEPDDVDGDSESSRIQMKKEDESTNKSRISFKRTEELGNNVNPHAVYQPHADMTSAADISSPAVLTKTVLLLLILNGH
ncbi:uncharacterized protein LOC125179486 [Hyalella azteca]|uniref:Uncharacterized protein LOC125179486 n=1 Tax=Hyalella azteca TaxID=294128 RepID=A0A979FXW8_HYAAZ|nr:uncharacterized protein LOC125179486 [Hyalella azteca]